MKMEEEIEKTSFIEIDDDPATLKVATKTPKQELVVAIMKTYKKHGYVRIKSVGGGAIKTAYEAVLEARSKLIKMEIDLIIIPNGFIATMPDGTMRPGSLMVIENR